MNPFCRTHLKPYNHQEAKKKLTATVLGIFLILFGIIQIPSSSEVWSAQDTQTKQKVSPPQTPPQTAPKLSILLLMDVSGSMADNNKLDQAKTAAIKAVKGALTPKAVPPVKVPQKAGPTTTKAGVAGAVAGVSIPPDILQKFEKNVQALEKLQKELGKDIRTWLTKDRSKDMGKILNNCDELMKGLAVEQKDVLMKKLNPLVEKMHYSIAARVNAELKKKGLTKGLKYVIPGKTPAHPEFGGLFTLKPSDHDAIYFGEGADEAVRMHKKLAANYGDDFLNMTESCLESSKYTIEHFERGLRKQAFDRFSGPMSNLDWMRSPSGSKWVQEYVDSAGTVVDLDNLDDVAKIKPAGESGSALRKLSSYTEDELRAIGMAMDRTPLSSLGYNLGLQSDFERQVALNRTRKGLEKGLQAATAEDTAMVMAKYSERYLDVLDGTGIPPQGTRWAGYVKELKEIGLRVKDGGKLTVDDRAVIDQFDEFAGFVRQQSLAKQMNKFASLKEALKTASRSGADEATIAGLRAQMTDLMDDTQAALHNYQQLYGKDFADDLVKQVSATHDDFARGLTRRLTNSPWVVNEQSIGFCVQKEMAAAGTLPDPGSTVPSKLLITENQGLWQYARQNPGHVLAKTAQFAAYAWIAYEVKSQLNEGKYDEAMANLKMFGGTELATHAANYMLASKFGALAGPGVVLAGLGGYMLGNAAAQWAISSQVDEMSLQMMTGYSNDGSRTFDQPSHALPGGVDLSMGLLEYMAKARIADKVDQNTGQVSRWVEFDNPSEATDVTDDQIMAQFKPGQYGDTTIAKDADGNVTITEYLGEKMVVNALSGDMMMVPDYKKTTMTKNQIIAHTRLQQMYQAMRGKYNNAIESGAIQSGNQSVPSDFMYVDPDSSIPGSQFSIPNPGGMTMNEFTYYRMMFERTWGRWSLDKNEQFNQSRMYWGANMENAYKAKWSMFKAFMAKMAEGKIKDKEFQEKLAKNTPEDLVALKLLAEQGIPFWLDGKKLTPEDIQKMIDKKLENRQKILKDMEDGVIQIQLPEELEKLLGELSAMTLGDIEIGIMPYSGGCSSVFNLFGFSRDPEKLEAAINSLSAGGGTPMTPALYQARHALLTVGAAPAGTIILLCDGQNDCAANPVEAADNIRTSAFPANTGGMAARLLHGLKNFRLFPVLSAQTQEAPSFVPVNMNDPVPPERRNIPISVSTVGFQVSQSEQQVLDEIAEAGGGVSGSAQDIDQLTQAFSSAMQTASRGLAAGGGGGGMVSGFRTANWPLFLVIFLVLATALLVVAILVLRNRRSVTPAPERRVLAYVDVTYQDGGTKSIPITESKATMGRSAGNTIILNDEDISHHHADLYITNEGMYIVDRNSTNGTFVSGKRVTKAWVNPSDIVMLGTTRIQVRT